MSRPPAEIVDLCFPRSGPEGIYSARELAELLRATEQAARERAAAKMRALGLQRGIDSDTLLALGLAILECAA